MRVFLILALAGAAGLAACNRGSKPDEAGKAEAPGAQTSAEAPRPAVPTPSARDLMTPPKRKPGLWEMRMSDKGVGFVQTMRMCIDEATDSKMALWGAQTSASMCRKNLVTRQLDGSFAFAAECDLGSGGKVVTAGTATGDFSSRYLIRGQSTTTGASVPAMNRKTEMTIEAAHVGPCPAGRKGGDVEMPGGVVINMLDLPAGVRQAP